MARRVALVHDWLNGMRGGERVLEQLCLLYPEADVHTLIYQPEAVSPTIRDMNVIESPWAQIPGFRTRYRQLLPLLPLAIRQLPTADYDLVISTSHCVAKATPPPRRGLHLSYVFSPMRYVWDHFPDYLGGGVLQDAALRAARRPLQVWDRWSCRDVDGFAADSAHIAAKVRRFWGRSAQVIYPPVELHRFAPDPSPPDEYFLVVSALVPYKRIERAIEACRIAKCRLRIVGSGPEEPRLRALAGPETEFLGPLPDAALPPLYARCQALLFPATEDFGITALEAMAAGRPVIAYAEGGVMETVLDGVTGRFFHEPSAEALAREIKDHHLHAYDAGMIRRRAEEFSPERFRANVARWIDQETRFLP